MEKLDFLFIYEHKVRELENLCLMKYELDRRGYKTKIIFINDAENALSPKPIYDTKVLCTMACYCNRTLRWHVKDYVKFEKIIDLQWENIVYPKDEDREDAFKNYIEIGKDVVRVSWGKQNQKRLLDAAHMDPKKVKLVGHVGMDFLQFPLCNYYTSREELFAKYNVPLDKEIVLFASPYYGDNLEQKYIDDMCQRFGENWVDYYKFMCESQRIVLQWFEQICAQKEDTIFIYRPHPGHPSLMAQELEAKYDNFKIISEESVKQWIIVSDRIYTGNSSVVVEAFFANKMCELLFPLPTTPGFELKLISDSRKITDYEAFYQSIYNETADFPTPISSIEEIYMSNKDRPSYQKFADVAQEVLEDDYYKLTSKQLHSYQEYSVGTRIMKAFCRISFIYNIYLALIHNEKMKWGFLQTQRKIRQQSYDAERNDAYELTSDTEIQEIIRKITKAINS